MSDENGDVEQPVVNLPNGDSIIESGPVVIVGPNGSGKTRRSRTISSEHPIEVVSALRNTKISPQLQAMALQQAKANFQSQIETARTQPYEFSNDFDFMLTALIGEAAEVSLDYLTQRRARVDAKLPERTTLEKIQQLWTKFFPGRQLTFRSYLPQVINTVAIGDEPAEYSAWQMSDGEKAALYLAGRTLYAEPNRVLLIDEPETHFHSLLAVRFWDEIEEARPDLRFIYVTHDMTFAASRKSAHYLLANPLDGLRSIKLSSEADDLAAVLLGTASLSFYATRIIFCEGDAESLDSRLYSAWFNSKEDVVQAVGSCDMVMRSVMALASSSLVRNLKVHGIIDRDFNSDENLSTLPNGVAPLGVHEVETLFCVPELVEMVARHFRVSFDRSAYEQKIVNAYSENDRHKVVLERWKLRVNSSFKALVTGVDTKRESLDDIRNSLPALFDQNKWNFSPVDILQEEKERVENPFATVPVDLGRILRLMPGKKLRAIALQSAGVRSKEQFDDLIISAVAGNDPELASLSINIRAALSNYLPVV
ncbi:AAA family ATPase [Nocardia aurea]|uniref:AAA family ATPase n=1 Tax=Nocardia aurea TaxID=2144174 RepID=A0ABV3FPU0_9NOCA